MSCLGGLLAGCCVLGGLAGLGWLVHLFGPPWAPPGSFCCYLSWVRSLWGLFYMRIYRRILSLGAFLHAHLPPYPFPWGVFTCAFTAVFFPLWLFYMRIFRCISLHTLICWLHHKIDNGGWRSYTMTTVGIRSAAHEAVKTLSAAHEAVETLY